MRSSTVLYVATALMLSAGSALAQPRAAAQDPSADLLRQATEQMRDGHAEDALATARRALAASRARPPRARRASARSPGAAGRPRDPAPPRAAARGRSRLKASGRWPHTEPSMTSWRHILQISITSACG